MQPVQNSPVYNSRPNPKEYLVSSIFLYYTNYESEDLEKKNIQNNWHDRIVNAAPVRDRRTTDSFLIISDLQDRKKGIETDISSSMALLIKTLKLWIRFMRSQDVERTSLIPKALTSF